ncbi:MAG: spore germination protein [Petroclostridium sp.]|jgi:spore germination protein KB|nr:hypothetical protein [Clostridia bacterium]MDK2810277.1 spore germination protein [Petroclostridium sp.]
MVKDVKISSIQLSFLIMGFILGSTAIVNPAAGARQDSWLAYIIGWAGGFILIGIYVHISILNVSKTLIEILKENFGKVLGSITAILYIWYFIHLAALVLRNFGEYMVTVIYPETPITFIMMCVALLIAYAVKNGLEVVARTSELFVPLLPVTIIFIFFLLIGEYDINNFLPFLENGLEPVLKTAFSVLSFPFGETVVFLMVFPCLNKRENIIKVSYLSVTIMGLITLNVILRFLLALGPDMFTRNFFPAQLTAELIPNVNVDPLIGINLLIGGGVKISVCLYAAVMGIAQLFNLDDYKPFVLPAVAIVVTLSLWVYDNLFEMFRWATDIWPYYSIPFQILIPLLLLMVSWIKKKRQYNA